MELIKSRKFRNELTSVFLLTDGKDSTSENALEMIENTIRSRKTEQTFTINTFGFGKNHDAVLMREVASRNGGNFYFIDDLESIDECFVDAMGMLFSVVLKDCEISVKLNNEAPLSDMRVKKTFGDMWSYDESKVYKIGLKIFTIGMKKDFICEVNLPPVKKMLQDEEKRRMVMSVSLKGRTMKEELIGKKADLFLNLMNSGEQIIGQSQLNIEVIVNHFRVRGAEIIELAKKAAENGEFKKAQNALDEFQKELAECGCKDHPSLVVLSADIEKSKEFCNEITLIRRS